MKEPGPHAHIDALCCSHCHQVLALQLLTVGDGDLCVITALELHGCLRGLPGEPHPSDAFSFE